jgi:fibronectin-binding autotransporter adhesin
MQTTKTIKTAWLLIVLLIASFLTARAQTTANWITPAGGDWNTAANWNLGAVPGVGTNAVIGGLTSGFTVTYSSPMAAASIGAGGPAALSVTNNLSTKATLVIGAGGFNVIGDVLIGTNGALVVNNGGNLNIQGDLNYDNLGIYCGPVTLNAGGAITVANGGAAFFEIGNNVAVASAITNLGGTLTADNTSINTGNANVNDVLYIAGGTNYLGNFLMNRDNSGGNSSLPAFGISGLIINGGQTTLSSALVGNTAGNSWAQIDLMSGTFTNTGTFIISEQATVTRGGVFAQTGGLSVSTAASGIQMDVNNSGQWSVFYVTGGTNITQGIVMGDSTVYAGKTFFTNAATVEVGSLGIVNNSTVSGAFLGVTNNVSLNNGGAFYASADWTGSVPMLLAGGASSTFTFNDCDLNGTPHNITLTGPLSGNGTLNITGAGGTLTLQGTNVNTGNVLINQGILYLGASGTLSNAQDVFVGTGATFDVTAIGSGFTLNSANNAQMLSGFGTVNGTVIAASGAQISPGSNALTGTLTFSGSVQENGNAASGVINTFVLSSNPTGPGNDLISVAGNLNLIGTNTVQVSGNMPGGATYTLITYGSFTGDITKLQLNVGPTVGYLSNNVAGKAIVLHTLQAVRGAANIVWVGNALANNWDYSTTNWLLGGALTSFINNDSVRFDDTGVANPVVNLSGTLLPNSVMVVAAGNYVFTNSAGSGGISGATTSLTKTNTGTLTIWATNNTYKGVTTIGGGVLQLAYLPFGGAANPGPIGISTSDSYNLVIGNATLRYIGSTGATDRGLTLSNANSTIDITNGATLGFGGVLAGPGSLNKVGLGTLELSNAANTMVSATVISGEVLCDYAGALGAAGAIINFEGGTVVMNTNKTAQQFYNNNFNVVSGKLIVQGDTGDSENILGTSAGQYGAWSGSGTLNLDIPSVGCYFSLNSPITSTFTGTIRMTDDSAGIFRLNSGGTATGAQECTGSTNATFDLGNSSAVLINRNGGGLTYGNYYFGALQGVGTNSVVKGANNGTFGSATSLSTYFIGYLNANDTYAGTIEDGAGGQLNIVKVGTGTWTLTGQNTYSGTTIVSNGVLALANGANGDGSIADSTNIIICSGAYLSVAGRSDDTLSVASGQWLSGNGTVIGNVVLNGGTISPGDGVGPLYVTGNIDMSNNSGKAWMNVLPGGSPNCDSLVATGTIHYGGTLVVNNLGTLHAGETFTLFSAPVLDSTTSQFNVVLPNYYTWNTSRLAQYGQISVVTASPPAITTVDYSNLANGSITLNAVNGLANGPVTVVTTTNLAAPLSSWTTVTTTVFDGNGDLNLPITVNQTQPQSFYMLLVN